MGNPIVHFEIRSDDPDATRAFYADLFGWTYPPGGLPGYTYVDSGVPSGTSAWVRAAGGMPNVEVTGLTIVPGKRILYAASHGLSAWKLDLRK